jgi:hypothetical protein
MDYSRPDQNVSDIYQVPYFLVLTHTYNRRIRIQKKRGIQNRNKVDLMPPTSETVRKLEVQNDSLDDLDYTHQNSVKD